MVERLKHLAVCVSGFSTLEMLIAMTLLSLTLSAVLLLVPLNAAGSLDTEFAKNALESAMGALALERSYGADDARLLFATTSERTMDGIAFHTLVNATPVSPFLTQVAARVSWGGWFGRSQGVELASLIANSDGIDGGDTCNPNVTQSWTFPLATHVLFGDLPGLRDSGMYPLTDIDVYHGRLYATTNLSTSPLPTDGPRNASSVTDDARIGTVPWNQSAQAAISDNAYALALLGSGESTHYLYASHFGFSIPRGATIIGIEVSVERKSSSNANTVEDSAVRIVRADGSLGATDKSLPTNWGTSDAYRTYGSSNDLWNESSWSADAVNNPDFGLAFAARASGGTGARTASVDHIRITVTYTKQFYVVQVTGTPQFIGGLGENTTAAGMNALTVATSTSRGNHAYVAMNSGVVQLEVIDITDDTPRVVASFHVPGASVVANALAYRNGYVFLGLANNPAGGELAIVDVHDAASPTLVALYEIGAGVNALSVHRGILSLATDDSAHELILLDVSDVPHPRFLSAFNAPGTNGSGQGRSLYTVGDTTYLGRYYSLTAAPEVITTTGTTSLTQLATYDAGPNASRPFGVYGVISRSYLLYLLTSSNVRGGALEILDASDSGHPSVRNSLVLPNSGSGRALDCEGDTLYAASVPVSGAYTDRGSLSMFTSL